VRGHPAFYARTQNDDPNISWRLWRGMKHTEEFKPFLIDESDGVY